MAGNQFEIFGIMVIDKNAYRGDFDLFSYEP